MARGFNISDFRAFREDAGILRTHDYIVEIPFPSILPRQAGLTDTQKNLELACDSCNFPMTGVVTSGVQRYSYGAVEQRPTLPKFSPLQCTFICDENANLYTYFHDWIRGIVNFGFERSQNGAEAYEINYKPEYAVDMHLFLYNPYGDLVKHVGFRDAFPLEVGDVALAWGRQNEMVKVPVAFTFTDWEDLGLRP